MSDFAPLRVRSHGSLLYGLASPEALVERALALGYRALALTDRDNLYLAVRFWQAARAGGLRPLPGAEIRSGSQSALLLPIDRRGFARMCELLTRRHLDPEFDLATSLAVDHAGLQVVVESAGLAASLLSAGVPPASGWQTAGGPRPGARPGGLWLGVRGLPEERPGLPARLAAARALGLPLVATGDVVLLSPADHDAHRAAVTAAAGELLDRMDAAAFASRSALLAPPGAWEQRIRALCAAAGAPEVARLALLNNAELVERCRLELELGVPIFPSAPLPAGETGPGYLRRLGRQGVARRYARGAARARRTRATARLEWELGLIERLGFTDYFLLVADIVEFARARGIPTVGRGSGAGSIVSYVLGITNVDPLRHGLYFERFLHPARRDCPDLDIDLCWKRRDEVIEHVYATYGHDRVAMIATHATLGARSAFRETAKVLGVPNAKVNALAKRVPRAMEKPYLERLRGLPEARGVDWREAPLPRALELAERLEGAPRHLSIHCGGLVIGDRPLTWYVPLERAAKGIVVTQFEMRAIEAIGLVKMDLLGNRALSTIGECVSLARAAGARVDIETIPDPDPATAKRLAVGDTLNCSQLESPAMRHLLRMLKATTLEETIAAVALVRPGPAESGMKEAFCRRQRGLEPATFLHPRLRPVLGSTHGVMLYEEDVMRVAAALVDIPLHEGDELRRAIGAARTDAERAALEHGFVQCARRAGIDESTARAVWRELARFAAYAFCKAHAAGYGTLAYQCTYLKTHHPAEFAVGILNHHAGMYETWVHVEDLRRQGVRFLAPCAQRSAWDATLERESVAVRVGLSRVFGVAETTGARILRARARRPFASLADLTERARPTLPELESLILAGALDWTQRTRPSLLLEARTAAATAAPRPTAVATLVDPGGAELLPEPQAPIAVPALPEFDVAERVRGERRACGLWFSGHPLDAIAEGVARGVVAAADVERRVGERAAVVGLPCAWRRVATQSGGDMLFMTLADRTGLVECVLFPDAFRANVGGLRGEVVRAEGRVEETLGAVTLTVERAAALNPS
jgi:DNA-directed DNA polymerase III PolC